MTLQVLINGVDYSACLLLSGNALDFSMQDDGGARVYPGCTLRFSNLDGALDSLVSLTSLALVEVRSGSIVLFKGYVDHTGVMYDVDNEILTIECIHLDRNIEQYLSDITAESVVYLCPKYHYAVWTQDGPALSLTARAFIRVNDFIRNAYNRPIATPFADALLIGGRESELPAAPETPYLPKVSAREVLDLICSAFNCIRFTDIANGTIRIVNKGDYLRGMNVNGAISLNERIMAQREIQRKPAGYRRIEMKYDVDSRADNATDPANVGSLINPVGESDTTVQLSLICPRKRTGTNGIPWLPQGNNDLYFFARYVTGQSTGNELRRFPISDTDNEQGLIQNYTIDVAGTEQYVLPVSLQDDTTLLQFAKTPYFRVLPRSTPGLTGTHYHASSFKMDPENETAELTLEGYS